MKFILPALLSTCILTSKLHFSHLATEPFIKQLKFEPIEDPQNLEDWQQELEKFGESQIPDIADFELTKGFADNENQATRFIYID